MCTKQEVTAIVAKLCSRIALLFPQNKIEAILFGSYARGVSAPVIKCSFLAEVKEKR